MRQTEALANKSINILNFSTIWSSLSFAENAKQAVPRILGEKYLIAKRQLKFTVPGNN